MRIKSRPVGYQTNSTMLLSFINNQSPDLDWKR